MRRESGSLIPLDILKTMTLNGAFWRILRIGLQLQRERERERKCFSYVKTEHNENKDVQNSTFWKPVCYLNV